MAPRRKKWTEEEERSLLDKYAEMAADGSISRLRTRERRFRPIAAHVNAAHHAADPAAYPFLWSWKDAANKVHNMRHQYLLVKRKLLLLNPPPTSSSSSAVAATAAVDWDEQGLSRWSNFLRYRSVFGDAPLPLTDPAPAPGEAFDNDGELALGLAFDDCAEGGSGEGADQEVGDDEGFDFDDVAPVAGSVPQQPARPLAVNMGRMKRRKKKRAERRRALAAWKEWEAKMEDREAQWERARIERERAEVEAEKEREQERRQVQRQRREEEIEWEERMEGRRAEWRKRMEGMLREHRVEMEQIQARIIHEQQSVVGQLLGVLSQWAASPVFGGLSDATGGGTALGQHHHHQHQPHHQAVPYLSQMVHGLHHVNGIVPGENRVDGDGHEDHFIVDD
ncbi:uncharacterized protein LOC103989256 [Musa acuminata AAA Group]|uniref:uncharacterized protein LOC103989256 n=1 Tax=Musa acuminata AAA Group TaxID=214697 RepID=UPI0031D72314